MAIYFMQFILGVTMLAETLENAIDNKANLRVRYFGGSSPGREREIQPISVKDGKVRAQCLLSGETKIFFLEKMELVVEGELSQLASFMPPTVVTYESVNDFHAYQTEALQQLGWVVQCEGKVISLHRTFKNGKLIYTPDVEIRYEAIAYDLVYDGEIVTEANHRERLRPWVVRAKKQTTKSYGDFGKAQIKFLEFAKLLSPLVSLRYT